MAKQYVEKILSNEYYLIYTLYFWSSYPKIQGMFERWIQKKLKKQMSRFPAVALLGARQVGKTTLASKVAKSINALYLDLEIKEDRILLQDTARFFELHSDKTIILDEIQRTPDLFMELRGVIDRNIAKGREAGQFVILGSASMELLKQSSESLAGRIHFLEMSGLNVLETGCSKGIIENLWLRGGFPKSYLAIDSEMQIDFLEDLIRTYLETDLPQFGFTIPAERLRRLWTMLAHLQGETINYSKLATNLEMEPKSVTYYIDILTRMLLVRRLNPWHENVKKRLIKSPRYYVRDSGILHRLLDINNYQKLLSNPELSKSWEGFVIENIHSVLPHYTKTYFYRTAVGAEIDLVIKMPNSEIWAIEIKYGSAPKFNKHFNRTCDDVGATHKYVVYGGDEESPVGNDIWMISLPKIMEKISKKNIKLSIHFV